MLKDERTDPQRSSVRRRGQVGFRESSRRSGTREGLKEPEAHVRVVQYSPAPSGWFGKTSVEALANFPFGEEGRANPRSTGDSTPATRLTGCCGAPRGTRVTRGWSLTEKVRASRSRWWCCSKRSRSSQGHLQHPHASLERGG